MSIFNFDDYRAFTRSFMEGLPGKGRGQVNKMADYLGVNSTLISQILTYRRDFSLEQAEMLCEYFGLSQLEAEYFMLLVEKERAGTQRLKDFFHRKIVKLKKESQEIKNRVPESKTLNDQERAIFYSSALYSSIRTFCSIGEGKSLEEICERFHVSREKATDVIQFLLGTGLLRQNKSLYAHGAQRTHLEQGSPYLPKHHANWRMKAIQRSEDLSASELMFTAPISIGRKEFELLKEDFLQLIQKVYSRVGETTPEEIACVNIDFFWIK